MVKNRLSFVKIEPESETDSDHETTVPRKVPRAGNEENANDEMDAEAQKHQRVARQALGTLCDQLSISSDMEQKLQRYFLEHPRMDPLPVSRSGIDIDLADPDEETWIIQCPASIDFDSELLNKKLDLSASRSTIKHCSVPLEASARRNRSEQLVGLLSGACVKSFVPTGFVRIGLALPTFVEPQAPSTEEIDSEAVPYPRDIRVRHPLLGYDYQDFLTMPKSVKKKLNFAQQKAALLYTTDVLPEQRHRPVVSIKVEKMDDSLPPAKAKKRKEPSGRDVEVTKAIEEEEPSAQKRKTRGNAKKNDTIKEEPLTEEDDISWLLNI